jgi:hypothetical protein
MAAEIRNIKMNLPYAFCEDHYLFRPKQLKAYFLANRTLQVPAKHTLNFWMNEHPPSSEWSNDTPPDLKKVERVLNEYLTPIGKTCKVVSSETVKIDALDDGFKLCTSESGFSVVLV